MTPWSRYVAATQQSDAATPMDLGTPLSATRTSLITCTEPAELTLKRWILAQDQTGCNGATLSGRTAARGPQPGLPPQGMAGGNRPTFSQRRGALPTNDTAAAANTQKDQTGCKDTTISQSYSCSWTLHPGPPPRRADGGTRPTSPSCT